jgi:hypothetical protein
LYEVLSSFDFKVFTDPAVMTYSYQFFICQGSCFTLYVAAKPFVRIPCHLHSEFWCESFHSLVIRLSTQSVCFTILITLL